MGKFKESDIDIRNVSTVETDSVAGKTVSEYVKSLGVKAGISGKYGCFKGDFKSSFKTDESVSEENSYAKALLTVKKNREIISGFQTAESLKPYLARQFEKDINDKNVDPRTIFKEYGTHVLSDIIIGGRVSINWEYTNTDNKTSKEDRKSVV